MTRLVEILITISSTRITRQSVPSSLVLQANGLYEDARLFCDWLETAEWLDARGPVVTARHLGVEREVLARLNSPIDMTLIRRFSHLERLSPGESALGNHAVDRGRPGRLPQLAP